MVVNGLKDHNRPVKYNYKLSAPDYVKIDVDGHEDYVMRGALKNSKNYTVKSLAIEIMVIHALKIYQNYEKFDIL